MTGCYVIQSAGSQSNAYVVDRTGDVETFTTPEAAHARIAAITPEMPSKELPLIVTTVRA